MALFFCVSRPSLVAVGALPPARLLAVRGAPRRLPRAPAVRRSARGFCGLLAPVGPSGPARPGGGPALRASACGLGLSAPALARRSGPRSPRRLGRSSTGAASARSARPCGAVRASLRSGRALVFCRARRSGPPRAARRLWRRLRPRSSARGGRGCRPVPRPPAL